MWLGMIKKQANIFFMIAQPKALKVEEAFVTTEQRGSRGKKINQRTMLWRWLLQWASRF